MFEEIYTLNHIFHCPVDIYDRTMWTCALFRSFCSLARVWFDPVIDSQTRSRPIDESSVKAMCLSLYAVCCEGASPDSTALLRKVCMDCWYDTLIAFCHSGSTRFHRYSNSSVDYFQCLLRWKWTRQLPPPPKWMSIQLTTRWRYGMHTCHINMCTHSRLLFSSFSLHIYIYIYKMPINTHTLHRIREHII